MTVHVNGQARQVEPGTTVAQLIQASNLTPDKVAVELNRRLLNSEKYDTIVKDGDHIEIVTFVGGG
ncbi:MAG: sulfur carrier protein ThiS [Phycisphaerales bacterium]|nr:sulfur carrier protein ThiS [Phycisphaerales bacterium]